MSLGPVMLDLAGPELDPEEGELLGHPAVGGVILFARNYHDPEQLRRLVDSIHGRRSPRLLVAVDHEGGRVQRFRRGFTALPPAATFGQIHDRDPAAGRRLARGLGRVLAAELRAVDIDLSFAPVLDLGGSGSAVIGDRAFHSDPDVVTTLAGACVAGMREAGMVAVGKHFPGHGGVAGDSHHEVAEDPRDLPTLELRDLLPFDRLGRRGLGAVMVAHVIFPRVDPRPAGYSRRWLGEILRAGLGFPGAVFSDDLSMVGAAGAGGAPARARAALDAGCDMVLVCNDRSGALAVVEALGERPDPLRVARLARLHGRRAPGPSALAAEPAYREAVAALAALAPAPELDLGDDAPA